MKRKTIYVQQYNATLHFSDNDVNFIAISSTGGRNI